MFNFCENIDKNAERKQNRVCKGLESPCYAIAKVGSFLDNYSMVLGKIQNAKNARFYVSLAGKPIKIF